jgi:fructose-bisphosphate aldolase class II
MPGLLHAACRGGYAVAAFNAVNDLTMEAVLAAAAEARSPVIVQVSVKTVRKQGARRLRVLFEALAARSAAPAALHLDHCPDRALIEECVGEGWNSVLFDASALSYEENLRQTCEVVELAHGRGVAVEGELESIQGVEDGHGSDAGPGVVALEDAVRFIRETGIDCFAPAIGTAHGVYLGEPKVNVGRAREIFRATGVPIVVHGGTGLREEVFRALIAAGAAKINISTQLKITYLEATRRFLASRPEAQDPLALFDACLAELKAMAGTFIDCFGSRGEAA